MRATCSWIAAVGSADVAIITFSSNPCYASSAGTSIASGTGAAIVAESCVIGIHAACNRIAAVRGATVLIIAVGRCSPYASLVGTSIGCSTGAAVIAWICVRRMHASRGPMAAVGSAAVSIIAVGRRSTYASSAGTSIGCSTGVAVVAWSCVRRMHAACGWNAAVGSADVAIITFSSYPCNASSAGTSIASGTGAAIVAESCVIGIHAACSRIAAVISTDVPIIAICSYPYAISAGTCIASGTGVAVVAWSCVRRMHAARGRIAAVGSADVPIIAVYSRSPCASSAGACFACSTGVAVVA